MGTEKAVARDADVKNHTKDDWRKAHHIWENVQPNLSKIVYLPARVNLSLTDPQTASYAEKDLSALVPKNAAIAILALDSANSRYTIFKYRPGGSTDDPLGKDYFQFDGILHFYHEREVRVPLNYTTKKFEYEADSETTTTYYLIGYITQGE